MSPKASQMIADSNLSFLFKGPPGFAKTCAACSFAALGPIYLAYFDKNRPAELDHYFRNIVKRPELLENIEYESFGSHNANDYLNRLNGFTRDCRYLAVITDSLTSLTSAAVNWSLGFRDPKGPQTDKLNPKNLKLIPDWDEYKVETSLVVQALDISMTLPTNIIWTAHPLPSIKIEEGSKKVIKTNSLVTYGSKVAGLVPGRFTEIYHFGKETDYNTNPSSMKYICHTEAIGDEFAKTSLDLPTEIDHTKRLFYEVWKEALDSRRVKNEVITT